MGYILYTRPFKRPLFFRYPPALSLARRGPQEEGEEATSTPRPQGAEGSDRKSSSQGMNTKKAHKQLKPLREVMRTETNYCGKRKAPARNPFGHLWPVLIAYSDCRPIASKHEV